MRLLYFLFWLAAAGTVYFLPDAFTDRYFTSGQLWACGLAGVAGMVLAYGKGVRCPRGVVALGVVLLAVWLVDVVPSWPAGEEVTLPEFADSEL